MIEQNDSSLLVSDELIDNLQLDDQEQLELLRKRSRLVILNFKRNGENDALIGKLSSVGNDKKNNVLNIELQANIDKNVLFFMGVKDNNIKLHGVDLHIGNTVVELLQTSEENYYNINTCNIFDLGLENEGCTLTLAIDVARA